MATAEAPTKPKHQSPVYNGVSNDNNGSSSSGKSVDTKQVQPRLCSQDGDHHAVQFITLPILRTAVRC